MISNKEIFLKWIENRKIPASELDHNLAVASGLKFDQQRSSTDLKTLVTEDGLESAFCVLLRVSD